MSLLSSSVELVAGVVAGGGVALATPAEVATLAGPQASEQRPDAALAEACAEYYADPLGFVLAMWPWGERGTLKDFSGPDAWQREFLRGIGEDVLDRGFDGSRAVLPIRRAVSSGHGVGKSTMSAWLMLWAMATRPHMQGVVTSTTETQLKTKLWAALLKWLTRSVPLQHWFEANTEKLYHKQHKGTWFITAQTCKEENSEAFAGQHENTSTSLYIFDEASGVPDPIYEVAEGGLTDGEPMIFLFGNPTKNVGKFFQACFGALMKRWKALTVDSRDSQIANKALFEEWAADYGEDSDFFRVRVRGLPPKAAPTQFIGTDLVFDARKRDVAPGMQDEALVCGLDVARGGDDETVWRFRCGGDARSIQALRLTGQQSRNTMLVVSKCIEILDDEFNGKRVSMMFIDNAGAGGPAHDRLVQLGYGKRVTEVGFGEESPDKRCANMRSYMWSRMRDWLKRGAIPRKDQGLEIDLTGPEYHHNKRDRLVLEEKRDMKARGLKSPDDGDSLALTFAASMAALATRSLRDQKRRRRAADLQRQQSPRTAEQMWMV